MRSFVDILFSEFRGLIKLNLLFCALTLPSVIIFLLGLFGIYSSIALFLSLIAAIPVGGAIAAYMFCLSRMLCDEPGYIMCDYKRKFTENIRQAAAPGILCAAFVYVQIYLWGPFVFGGVRIDAVWIIPGIVLLAIFGMVAPYFFIQIAYLDLSTKQILINSVILAFTHAPRSLIGAVMGSAFWVAFVLLLPESLVVTPLLLLFGVSLSWLLCLMWVWPPVNKTFRIEETLRERKNEKELELGNQEPGLGVVSVPDVK